MTSLMKTAGVSRRDFLRTGAAGGAALVVGFYLPDDLSAQSQERPRVNPFNAWIRIGQDGRVALRLAKSEMGQGVMTALPMILAEELEVEWSTVHVEQAETRPDFYGDQGTGGSDSVMS